MNARAQHDLDWALEQAEQVERGARRPVTNSREMIRDMAERMAAERKERRRRAALIRRAPDAVEPIAREPVKTMRESPRPKARGEDSWTVKILKALRDLPAPARVGRLYELVPGIKYRTLSVFLVRFADLARQYAVRHGAPPDMRYSLGPKGRAYLETFHPPD